MKIETTVRYVEIRGEPETDLEPTWTAVAITTAVAFSLAIFIIWLVS